MAWASEIINLFPGDLSSTPDEALQKDMSCLIPELADSIIDHQTNHRMDGKMETETELLAVSRKDRTVRIACTEFL